MSVLIGGACAGACHAVGMIIKDGCRHIKGDGVRTFCVIIIGILHIKGDALIVGLVGYCIRILYFL